MLKLHEEYLIHRKWMKQALKLSQLAGEAGEVPVGAVIIDSSQNMIAEGENRKQRDNDPTAHAEIIAIREAARRLQRRRHHECIQEVTGLPALSLWGALLSIVFSANFDVTDSGSIVYQFPIS